MRTLSQHWLNIDSLRNDVAMPKDTVDFDAVRKIGLALPEVEESTMYGAPALKLHGQLLACIPTHRSAEPGSLAVRVDFADRDELIAAAPDIYYVKEHYVEYNAVLVRLSRIDPSALKDLLAMAYKFVSRKASRSAARKRPKPRKR
jgi:hypothetical protein